MRQALFIFFYYTIVMPCIGQLKAKTDSLENELSKYPQQDTNRLRILNQLVPSYWGNNPTKGLLLADEAILVAKKFNNTLALSMAYNAKGLCYYTKGAFDTSLTFHQLALDVATKTKDEYSMPRILNRIGGNYISLSDYTEATFFLQKGLVIAEKNNDKMVIAALVGNLASVYFLLSDYTKALEYAFRAVEIYKEQHSIGNVALMYNNIGSFYLKAKNDEKAIEYNLRSLKIADSMGAKKGVANAYLDIGNAYTELKNYSLGIDYLSKSLGIYTELGSKYNASLSLSGLATAYNLAPDSVLKRLGINLANRLNKVLQYQHDAIALAKETKNLDNLSNQWESLSRIFESNKRYDSSLYAFKQYAIIHDSIAGDKKKQEITRKETLFEAEKKEAVLNAQHAIQLSQEKTTRNIIIISTVILLIGGLLSFVLYKRKKDAVAKQKEAELNLQMSDTEMKALRAQMNPHFIFNSLNSISDYLAKNNTAVADEYLTKFAKLMRLVLENSEQKEVPLSIDMKTLELYMQLEALRLKNKFTYTLQIDEELDKETTMIPPLILQPFVENSIWHGIAKMQGDGNISIQIKKEGEMINCIVEDNGIGRTAADGIVALKDNTGKRSLGMKITKERIDIINKLKKTNAAVKLTDLQQGTRVEVMLPLTLNF